MESLPLFKNTKQRLYFLIFIVCFFSFNLFLYYNQFLKFKNNEIIEIKATILNIYEKDKYKILKLTNNNITFFTSITKDKNYKKLQTVNLYIITKNISFLEYLKGFYTKSFNINPIKKQSSIKQNINSFIISQHQNPNISSLYSALFLAININQTIREFSSNFGIAHLIAISGFHLGVISFVIYFLFNIFYSPLHQKYFPYRNKRLDIIIFVSIVLFSYLILIDMVPSFLRAFLMFIFGVFLLRNHIKILSFETLFIIVLIIIALFPKLLFSLSLWFSIAGVFYIYLFLHYFKNLNKYLQFILFNFWIYFAMNPIVHYFFGVSALEQLFSPLITLVFTLFYPLSIILHILNMGYFLDGILIEFINYNIQVKEVFTPFWLFISYILVSLFSIFNKNAFILLNILFIIFGIYIFI